MVQGQDGTTKPAPAASVSAHPGEGKKQPEAKEKRAAQESKHEPASAESLTAHLEEGKKELAKIVRSAKGRPLTKEQRVEALSQVAEIVRWMEPAKPQTADKHRFCGTAWAHKDQVVEVDFPESSVPVYHPSETMHALLGNFIVEEHSNDHQFELRTDRPGFDAALAKIAGVNIAAASSNSGNGGKRA